MNSVTTSLVGGFLPLVVLMTGVRLLISVIRRGGF